MTADELPEILHVAQVELTGRTYAPSCTCSWDWPGWSTYAGALEALEAHLRQAASGKLVAP